MKIFKADDKIEKEGLISMGDDGMGDLIKIPSIFIDEVDGILLRREINKNKDSKPMISVEFSLLKVDHVNLMFFLQIPNKEGFVIVREFNEVRK